MKTEDKYPKAAGIYKLTCIYSDKVYIGKAINIHVRLNRHRNCEKNTIGRCYFENAIIKYGWNAFSVEILEMVKDFDKTKDNNTLLEREAFYIKMFDSTNKLKGYNGCGYSTDRTGSKHSDDTKRKMSLSRLGKHPTEETRKKMSISQLGRSHSEATKIKMRTPRSEKYKEKRRQLHLKHTDETKDKMRQCKLGISFSEEHKKNLSLAKLGIARRPFTKETIEKMRQAKLGKKRKPMSEETKQKIKQTNLIKKQLLENKSK